MITKVKSDFIISISEARSHLRVDTTDEDNYILQLIRAALGFAEQYINKDIAFTVNTLVFNDFCGSLIEIDEGNLVAISSIKNGAGVALSNTYELKKYDCYFSLEFDDPIPETDLTIEFTTGFTALTIPAAIKQAILIKIADMYDVDRSSYGFQNYQKNAAESAFTSLLNYYIAQRVRYIKN